jgi:hypothetical protein
MPARPDEAWRRTIPQSKLSVSRLARVAAVVSDGAEAAVGDGHRPHMDEQANDHECHVVGVESGDPVAERVVPYELAVHYAGAFDSAEGWGTSTGTSTRHSPVANATDPRQRLPVQATLRAFALVQAAIHQRWSSVVFKQGLAAPDVACGTKEGPCGDQSTLRISLAGSLVTLPSHGPTRVVPPTLDTPRGARTGHLVPRCGSRRRRAG